MRNLILFLYLIINVFLYTLNFELFNSSVNVDFGFGVFSTMPLILIQLIGLVFILLFVFIDKNKALKNTLLVERLEDRNKILLKDLEINQLKLKNILLAEQTVIPAEPIN